MLPRFATKANFRMNAEEQNLDLIEFIVEYVQNIATIYNEINLSIHYTQTQRFKTSFKPIEMTILIDNLISNAKKAKAKNILITIDLINDSQLKVLFKDDGFGIPLKTIIKNFIFMSIVLSF